MKFIVKPAKDKLSFQVACPYTGTFRNVTTIPCFLFFVNAGHTLITIVKATGCDPHKWEGLYSGEYTDTMKEEVKKMDNVRVVDEDDKEHMIN